MAANREDSIRGLFKSWDLDGNGTVEYSEMQQILQASEKFEERKDQKWIKKFEAQINQGQRENRRGSISSLSLKGGGEITFSEIDGEPSLDPDAFVNFLSRLVASDTDEEFEEFLTFSNKWIEDAISSTQGSKTKKEIWEIFQLLDMNSDGHVDMKELELLLNAEKRSDRKVVLKWRAKLQNRVADDVALLPYRKEHDSAEEDRQLRLTLRDFQEFIQEYVEDDVENKISNLVTVVRKAAQEHQVSYIVQYKIHDVINDIMDDLLKERPQDVLAGIKKSVDRLQRTQKYPKPLKRAADKEQ